MNEPSHAARGTAWVVFWIALAVLAFEIALMRVLLVTSFHHFAFLVISVVLLGFGASGTVLTMLRRQIMPRAGGVLMALAVATAVAMPAAVAVAQRVPIESRIVPDLLGRQLGQWLVYWSMLAVPVVTGAATICLGLMMAGDRLPRVYAANLIGSGLGALAAPVLMLVVPPAWLAPAMVVPALVAVAGAPAGGRRVRLGLVVVCAAAVMTWVFVTPPRLRTDPYKYSAHLERLAVQDMAERVAQRHGPRGLVEAWQSDVLHDLPFISIDVAPPPLAVLTVDGDRVGSVLDVGHRDDAAVVDQALMAAAYELAPPQPRVLLLGESGGSNVWLAARRDARTIVTVQSNPHVDAILRGPLASHGGDVFARPEVTRVVGDPRHHVDRTRDVFDVIQLVTLEGSSAGSGGVGGMAQDFLVTREGIGVCLDRLADDGILFACRGIQTPPRDNVKLLATIVAALRARGVETPAAHVVIVRDFLAVCTIVRPTPWTADEIATIRATVARRGLTPVWFTGVAPDELNAPDVMPVPEDGVGDWYHYATRALCGDDADAFLADWAFDVRPATDDRPFFFDMCRVRAIGALREAFGDLWLARSEVAFLFVLVAGAAVIVVGGLFILVPLPWLRGAALPAGRPAIVAYFGAIGLGYLLLEMAFLSRLTRLVGDPVIGASVTIAAFLVLSGAGSLTAQAMQRARGRRVAMIFAGIVVTGAAALLAAGPIAATCGGLPLSLRAAVAIAVIAPVAYAMGFPMPLALARLESAAPGAVPWAWAINGFASVLATPLALVLAMTWGFSVAGAAALALYVAAGTMIRRLPRRAD